MQHFATRLLALGMIAALITVLTPFISHAAVRTAQVSIEMVQDAGFMEEAAAQQGQTMPEGYEAQKDIRKGTLVWGEGWLRIDVEGGKGRPGDSWLYEQATRTLYELNTKKKTYTALPQREISSKNISTVLTGQAAELLILRWAEIAALEEAEGLSIEDLGSSELEGYETEGTRISGQGGFASIPGGMEGLEGMEIPPGMEGMFGSMMKLNLTLWVSAELEVPLSFAFSNMGMETQVILSEIEMLEAGSTALQIPGDYTIVEQDPAQLPQG